MYNLILNYIMFYISKISDSIKLCSQKSFIKNYAERSIKTWKVLFFGSDDFSLISLEALYNSLGKTIQTLEAVSLKAKKVNPIYNFSVEKNLKHHVWPPTLTDFYDVGVVVSFGKLIPERIINHFPLGVINIHPSLIPQYRGGMPIYHAMKNGESETGVTVMKIKPLKFDTGDIIMQVKCKIGEHELMPTLRRRLAHLGAKCLINTINDLPQCLERSVPQVSLKASSAPVIKEKKEAIVQWDKLTAAQVYNIYRGLFGSENLKTTWEIFRIQLLCIYLQPPQQSNFIRNIYNERPGSIEYCPESKVLRVFCIDKPLYVCTLRMKNRFLSASDFHRRLQRLGKKSYIFK